MKTLKSNTVAFTGHRSNRIHADMQQLTDDLDYMVSHFYFRGYRTFLTGMSEGFDLLAAEAVLRLKAIHTDIRLVAVLPFTRQAYHLSKENQKRYGELFKQCDESVLISDHYYKGCIHRCNDYLVDNASQLIAYYDGKPKGVTCYTVQRAISNQVAVFNLFDHQQVNKWWSGLDKGIKTLFTGCYDGTEADHLLFWNHLHPFDRESIYRFWQVKAGEAEMQADDLHSLMMELASELAEAVLEMEFGVSCEAMYDENGSYYDRFQNRFNDLYDDIEYRLSNYQLSNQNHSILKVTVPKWKANLFISLFYADGGDGFTAKEVEDAELFIQENGLLSLVDIAEFDEKGYYLGDEIICSFRVSSEMNEQ